jgi:hypothetical protein
MLCPLAFLPLNHLQGCRFRRVLATCVVLSTSLGWAQTPIVTWHYDNARSGANTTEGLLTPANVNASSFGKQFTQPVDGFIVGHPLYLPGVSIPGAGIHNAVYVATMNDTVYAFDANSGNLPALWTTSLLSYSPPGATPVPIAMKGCASTVQWTQTGVISTPVIDPASRTIYLVAETAENGNVVHRMHALDVTTGKEQPGWPATIAATYPQNGKQSTFVDTHQMNRPGLLLSNGHVYAAFGGASCNGGNQGWVMSYNSSTAQQEGAFDVEPGGFLASIWQKGAGISADSDGNIYAESGEGPVLAGVNLGNSVFKLSQVGAGLSLTDWFTPWNWATLNAQDLDLNDGVVLLPDQSSGVRHEAISLGKEGTIYVLDRDHLGNFCSSCTSGDTQIVQELPGVATMGFTPAVWNGSVYVAGAHNLQIYSLAGGLLVPGKSVVIGSMTHPMITANGNRNGIVWLINGAQLMALDATNLTKLYTSSQAANGRDTLPPYAHFASPIAADGEVFIGTQNSLVVYGLFPELSGVAGAQQTAAVATTLPVALQVLAKNPDTGKPLAGVTVAFSDGGKGGTFGSPTGVTDAAGLVSTTYTLAPKSGSYTVTARAAGYKSATFAETATAGAAVALADLSGKGQTAPAGTALANPLVVKARDSYGNGVPGIAIAFGDGGAGGTLSAGSLTTNNLGQAKVTYTTGTKARNVTIYARATGLHSIAFVETVSAGPAASITKVSGDGQSAPVSTTLPQPLVVQVTDQYGNPARGVNVQFSDGGAGGQFDTDTLVSDSTGSAAASYTTAPVAGDVTIQATAAGVSGAASFSVRVH